MFFFFISVFLPSFFYKTLITGTGTRIRVQAEDKYVKSFLVHQKKKNHLFILFSKFILAMSEGLQLIQASPLPSSFAYESSQNDGV